MKITLGSFRIFSKIREDQGAPQVSMTPAANLPPLSTTPVANLPAVLTTPAAKFSTGTTGVVDTGGN
jgi:hypothetical protein